MRGRGDVQTILSSFFGLRMLRYRGYRLRGLFHGRAAPDRLKLFQIYACIGELHRVFAFFAITHPILASSVFSRHPFTDRNAEKEFCADNTSVPDLDLATPAQGRNCGCLPQAGGLPS